MFPLSFSDLAQTAQGQLVQPQLVDRPVRELLSIENVSIDTRTLASGDLFFALNGSRYDGHDFIAEAFSKGAIGGVVSSRYVLSEEEILKPILVVEDTLKALQKLAQWNRGQSESLMIGITGSVGKTTTRHMIHTVLSETYSGIQNPRNYNNQIGVPLSLLQLMEGQEFAVIEFGASAPGEIAELAGWVEPEIGIMTRLGPAHLDGFGSLETVFESKAELIDSVTRQGLLILSEETARLPEINRRLPERVLVTGFSRGCNFCAENVQFRQGCLNFTVNKELYSLRVPGKHFLDSALLTIALARELGMSPGKIQNGFDRFEPLHGRCQVRQIGPWVLLDDCYNANPLSVHAALETLTELSGVNRRIAVLGDMLGLGSYAGGYHYQMGSAVAKADVDFLLAYGDYSGEIANGAYQGGMNPSRIGAFNNFSVMQDILSLWLEDHTGLLVKGSRNMRMERVLFWLEKQVGLPFESNPRPVDSGFRKAS